MKILFINPAISIEEPDAIWASSLKHNLFGKMSFIPRAAPMVLAAVTPPEYSFTYLDEDIDELHFDKVDADLIAITMMTVQAKRAYNLADEFRRRGYPVILGGIHASSCPDEAALHADAICVGEGENSWPVMLDDFAKGRLKKFYHAKDYPPVTKLSSPRVDIVNHDSYSVFPLQATKGCPYHCDFCCISFSSGHKYRTKPIEQVVAEIKELEKYNTGILKKRYNFNDDNLYVDKEYTIKLFKAIIPLNIQWMGMGSINTIQDEEVVKLMAQSGCRTYAIGFESISEENLQEAKKKNSSVAEYKKAAQVLIKHGIIPAGYFIFGFEHDDMDSFKRTIDFAIENRIINPYFNILTPFPGTQLYERIKDRIFDWNWSHYGSLKCVYQPATLSPEQLVAGSYGASREVARLDILKNHLKYFWSHGPWEKNPKLKFKDRLFLIILALKIWGKKEQRKFLLWAAFNSAATDTYQIVATVTFYDMAKRFVV
ncbi:MAG: B12-binding domain-containing radical SAM protein [Firmicutes bacterium]|nr:B12-binding domain-containing radical SAM protein [Bacillota bacterium]